MGQFPVPSSPWEMVSIDIIGPILNSEGVQKYAIVLVDRYSKCPEVEVRESVDTEVVLAFLNAIFVKEGIPKIIMCDNGPQFIPAKWEAFMSRNGIEVKHTPIYHPAGNGLAERFNRVIMGTIQAAISDGQDWEKELPKMLWAYRITPGSTGYSQFKILRGREPFTKDNVAWRQMVVQSRWSPAIVKRNLERAQETYTEHYNKRRNVHAVSLEKGDWSLNDQETYHYGNKATVLCTPDGFFVVVISRNFVSQSIRLDTAHFADGGAACQPKVATASFRLFRFPLHQCGTIVQMLSDRIVYENTLKSAIDVQHSENGSITRDTAFTLTVRCSYTTSDSLQAVAEVLPLPPPQNIFESGPLRLEMRIAKDALYSAYYTEEEYPIVKVLRDLIFVEVRLLQRTDPSLRLVLDQCWAGPTSNPRQEPQWPILVDGCPFSRDNLPSTTVSLDTSIQFPSHYSRFTAAAFTFVDFTSPLSHGDQVYFFCAASVCHPTAAEQCTPLCPPPRGRQKRFLRLVEDKPMNLVISPGPLILRGKPIVDQKIRSSPLPTSAPLLLTWLPVAAGVATGMAVTLLALSVLCWRKIGQAVFAGTMQK
ncbi:zona pellucida sperm-binding protein 4-like [Lissotriton helveticus]